MSIRRTRGDPGELSGRYLSRILAAAGILILTAGLVVVGLELGTDGAWRRAGGIAPGDVPAADTSTDQLLSLRFTIPVDEGTGGRDPFRPVGGAAFGDEAVLIDTGSLRLLFVSSDGSLRDVPMEPPDTTGAVAPRFTGLVATSTGIFVVADLANGNLWRYGADGRFLGGFFSEDTMASAALTKPTALTLDGDGNLFVADSGDQTIKVFNKAGTRLLVMGGDGSPGGALDHPNGVAVGSQGFVYVADSNNRRVQVYDREGRPSSVIGVGEGSPALLLPRSLGIDSQGHVHVVDSFVGVVRVFERDGTFVGSYGADPASGELLSLPEGLAITGGVVVVGDRGNGRLAVFAE